MGLVLGKGSVVLLSWVSSVSQVGNIHDGEPHGPVVFNRTAGSDLTIGLDASMPKGWPGTPISQ